MPTMAPERADEIITGWLAGIDPQGWDNPAGPLFVSGKYAEADITMTGHTPEWSYGVTGCAMCTGSWCGYTGIECL